MKKIIYLLGLLFFFGCASNTYLVKKPYLYEIKKNDKVSYIFGSLHLGIHEDDLPKNFWSYVDQSSMVLSEVDLKDEETASQFKAELAKRIFLRKGEKKITDVYTNEEIQKILSVLKKANSNWNESSINRLSSYGVWLALTQRSKMNFVGDLNFGDAVRVNKQFGLDQQILDRAKSKDKYTNALDSPTSERFMNCYVGEEEQLIKINKRNLAQNYRSINLNDLADMLRIYRQGDTEKLLILFDSIPTCILDDRNSDWMSAIIPAIQNYPKAFIVVGVAHLIAKKNSLIDELVKEGYSVRRIEDLDAKEN